MRTHWAHEPTTLKNVATAGDIEVNTRLTIPAAELTWRFGPSGGPGGQHANTANTRAELVFEIGESEVLTTHQRDLLEQAFGQRLRVVADDARSQLRNRQTAADRLAEKIRQQLKPKTKRRPTKPSRGSTRRRLDAKKRQSRRKADRQRPTSDS